MSNKQLCFLLPIAKCSCNSFVVCVKSVQFIPSFAWLQERIMSELNTSRETGELFAISHNGYLLTVVHAIY